VDLARIPRKLGSPGASSVINSACLSVFDGSALLIAGTVLMINSAQLSIIDGYSLLIMETIGAALGFGICTRRRRPDG
jgi:hypothetical protein